MSLRVEESELEYDGDLRCYDDLPFSGVGYEVYQNGALKAETTYVDGLPSGACREWYPDGKSMSEIECKKGMKFGLCRHWSSNGSLRSEAHYEWGIELDYAEWDETGKLVLERKLDPESPESNYGILQKFRRVYGVDG